MPKRKEINFFRNIEDEPVNIVSAYKAKYTEERFQGYLDALQDIAFQMDIILFDNEKVFSTNSSTITHKNLDQFVTELHDVLADYKPEKHLHNQ